MAATTDPNLATGQDHHLPLKRIEHYALAILNGMAAGGSGGLTDGDIDYAIDVAERLARRMVERGHLHPEP